MIYPYIVIGVLAIYSIVSTGAYLEERNDHKKTAAKARKILSDKNELIDTMAEENARLSLIAKAYRSIAILSND